MKASILLSSKLYSEEKGLSGSPPTSLHLCFRVQAQFDNNLFGRDASLCNRCFPPLVPFLSCSANTCVCMEHLQNSARWKLYIHAVHVYIQTTHTCLCIYASVYVCIYLYTRKTLDIGISRLDEFTVLLYCVAVKALTPALQWDRNAASDCLQDPTTSQLWK